MVQESIEEIKKKAERFESQYNKLKQEFKDYIESSRKNEEKRRQEIKTDFSKRLLVVADSLNRIAGLDNDNHCEIVKNYSDNTRKNIEVIYNQMLFALGLSLIEPANGDKFDEQKHIAVGVEYAAAYPENTIFRVIRRGYLLENNVVRPAEVIVIKNPVGQKAIKPGVLDRLLGWVKPKFIFAEINQKMDELERLQKERIEKLMLEMDSLKNILNELNLRAKQTNEFEQLQKEKTEKLAQEIESIRNIIHEMDTRSKQTNGFERIQKDKPEEISPNTDSLEEKAPVNGLMQTNYEEKVSDSDGRSVDKNKESKNYSNITEVDTNG